MSEFDLINRYFKSATADRNDVLTGIGDDCAILSPPADKQLAISTDTLISGVHFPENTSAENIGYKSLAVNLSDLAAMGAQPAWCSLAITMPEPDENWLKDFMRGFNRLSNQYDVSLIGGDTTRGELSVTINVIGFVDSELALQRNRAKPGDQIFVTGTIGDARIGLDVVLNDLQVKDAIFFRQKLNQPVPRIESGIKLTDFNVAAIDLSDGLLADLGHICNMSDVGAKVFLDKIPLSESLLEFYQQSPEWGKILNAGDDYELCFSCPENNIELLLHSFRELPVQLSCIGEIVEGNAVECLLNGSVYNVSTDSGYDHF